MRLLLLSLMLIAFGNANARTAWERWLSDPTKSSADKVTRIEYETDLPEPAAGQRVTRDIEVLSKRVRAGDVAALRMAVRLSGSTESGANLEDIAQILGSAVRPYAPQLLRALKSAPEIRGCPGVGFLGERYVDKPASRRAELAARRAAIESVTDPTLAMEQARCLAGLAGAA